MKRRIYKLLSSKKQGLLALALAMFSGTAYSQATYTLNYTGGIQTMTLQAGTYDIKMWGANGETAAGQPAGGIGGYSAGTYSASSTTTIYIAVGGKGNLGGSTNAFANGGWNGGGQGYGSTVIGAGGGGASHIATATGVLSSLSGSQTAVIIVAGGGGGSGWAGIGGNGGGIIGGNGNSGTGGNTGGTFGVGANGTTVGTCGGGGGGWFGGNLGNPGNTGGAGGGSGYIGGVTSGTTVQTGQPGFVAKPIVTGDGLVIIKELCNITLSITGVNSSSAICAGNSVTLTTNAISNYSWSTGATTSSIVVSPTSNTSYSLTATSPSNCTASSQIAVVVNTAVPTLTIANTANVGGVCPTQTVNLLATGAITYTWTGGTPTVTNGVTFAPAISNTYIVTGANGCGTSTAVASVSIHPFPTVNTSVNNSTLCAGATLILNATGNATNYAWSGGASTITNNVGFVPTAAIYTYSVVGTSALSCTALATVPVTVYATPATPPTANPPLICIGGSSTLSAVGALTYTWASASQTVFTPNFTVTPSAVGISTYTITKSNSTCSDTKTISVVTNSLPAISAIALPNQVCALQPATLSVAGGQSYTWTAPGTPTYSFNGANPVVYPQVSSVYTVAAHDGTCINVATLSLSVDPNPTVSISATSPSVCSGQSVTLTASGGNSYTWTTPSGISNAQTLIVSPLTATAYTLTGNNSFSCTGDANQVILVYQSLTVSVLVNKSLVCSGGASTLTANGALSYTWDANAGSVTNSLVVVNPTNTVSGPVTYTVTGINSLGCPGTQTAQVNVYVPTLAVTGNTSTCAGGQIKLVASGTNASGFIWNTGSTSSGGAGLTITVGAAGIFTVSANSNSNSVSCPATQTVAISIYPNPSITAVAQRTTICQNEQVDIQAFGGVNYSWNNAMNGATITVSPLSNTNYTVTGTDANNCVGTGTVQVKVSGCNGINELNNSGNDLLIYPNPNNGEFIIVAGRKMDLLLVNELGQTVRSLSLTESNQYSVPVSDLVIGVYFLSGKTDAGSFNQKIIVTR